MNNKSFCCKKFKEYVDYKAFFIDTDWKLCGMYLSSIKQDDLWTDIAY